MSESTTQGLIFSKLKRIGYPQNQDENEKGITIYKEDSYKDHNEELTKAFSKASKSLSGESDGRPDFVVTTEEKIIIAIECKQDVEYHQSCDNLDEYKKGIGTSTDIQNYAINGVLHYAQYINDNKDVIAIAASGTKESNMRITSFVMPQGGSLSDIELLEDGDYTDSLMSIEDYIKSADNKLGRNREESEKVFSELSTYAISCANYLRANGISAKDRAGFISAIVLALTNEDSAVYKNCRVAFENMLSSRTKHLKDIISSSAIDDLKLSLKDIWENKDNIPKMKRDALEEYYDKILTKSLLNPPEGQDKKYFKYGDNVLSCCLYSIYEHIISTLKSHTDLDIMGTFYTVFLKYAKGDAKDKGIVLTPKHITELFCDIAEHYLGQKLYEDTKVLDTCCGTGGFLIAALNRMDYNINGLFISEEEKRRKREKVRQHSLIGVEAEPEMFALAYANMRFHGDGKSNLYSCSSLLKDRDTKGIAGKDPLTGKRISLQRELKKERYYNPEKDCIEMRERKIDVGMINPPYSLSSNKSKNKKGEKQVGQSELDFVYSMLSYLRKGGIGIAIVPIACACNKGKQMREIILKEHTLLACMSMPKQLFQNSEVGTTTCIMVFKAHVPHKESDQIVFMSRWLDDGFITIPHNGRYDKDNRWFAIKQEWLRQLKGIARPNEKVYLKKKINGKSDCVAEAYVETDYSNLRDEHFIQELKKYNLYLYQLDNFEDFLNSRELVFWLLDNYEKFTNQYRKSVINKELKLDISEWKDFRLGDETLFEIERGSSEYIKNMENGNCPYVSTTQENNGISAYKNKVNREGNLISLAYDGTVGEMFYQKDAFFASEKIVTIDIIGHELNVYIAFFLIGVLKQEVFRYSYGRKWTVEEQLKDTIIRLPEKDGLPDYEFMETYIKSLPYSKNI